MDNETRKLLLLLHELLFLINSRDSFICTSSGAVAGTRNSSTDPPGRMKEGNVLFNDTLNTFYLQLYGVGHNYDKGPFR